MVLLSPVLLVSAASTMFSLLEFIMAPSHDVASEEECMESFNAWFYPARTLPGAAPNATISNRASKAGSKGTTTTVPGASSHHPGPLSSTASYSNTLDLTSATFQLLLPVDSSLPLHRLSASTTRVSQASSSAPLASLGCTELASSEHQLRESQGSPRPSASVLGFQGPPEAEAIVAGLCTHELPSCFASKMPQGSRAAPAAARGVPHQSEAMPVLRHVVPRAQPSAAGAHEGEEGALLGGSTTVKALIGMWETRGNRIREQIKTQNADRKMRALRPCQSLPARLE